jgi:quinol-cytochrome oxidoreductase complex cytochrome b subunit
LIENARRILSERLALRALEYQVPRFTLSVKYMLGGLTAFLLLVLIATGLYLSQYYNPTVTGAHDSVLYLITRAPLGDWIRTLHFVSAGGVVLTVTAHLCYTFWRRSYKKPREVTWWAGVLMAAIIFLLIVTGTVLRYDQEGLEALAHFVSGGNLTGAFGRFFTDSFTPSTALLTRIFGLHTSLLPLVLAALVALHFWLIRHLGIHTSGADGVGGAETGVFRSHATRLVGFGLVLFAALGVLAILAPEGIGYPPVAGVEITKPFWPVLWVYGLENLLGAWGMILGPAAVFLFLMAMPLLDRGTDQTPGNHGWVGWLAVTLGILTIGLWVYGVFGEAREHIGM